MIFHCRDVIEIRDQHQCIQCVKDSICSVVPSPRCRVPGQGFRRFMDAPGSVDRLYGGSRSGGHGCVSFDVRQQSRWRWRLRLSWFLATIFIIILFCAPPLMFSLSPNSGNRVVVTPNTKEHLLTLFAFTHKHPLLIPSSWQLRLE